MKRMFLILLAILPMIVLTFSCSGDEEEKVVYAERIDIDKKEIDLVVGEEVFIKCNVYPSDAVDGRLNWSSEHISLVEFDGKGTIKAKKDGFARIKINNESHSIVEYIMINIKPRMVEGISLAYDEVEIQKGHIFRLFATVTPIDASDKTVDWISSDINIAKVTIEGDIFPVNVGECTITAVSNSNRSIAATCKVTVLPPPPAPIERLSFESYVNSVRVGDEIALKVIIYPENYIEETLVWSSDDPSIATVSQSGKVKGIKQGVVAIRVKTSSGKVMEDCRVTVNERTDIVNIVFGGSSTSSINGYVTGDVTFRIYNGTERSISPVRVYITESLQGKVILEVDPRSFSPLGAKESTSFWSASFNWVYRPVFHCEYLSGGVSYTISKE